MKVTLINHTIDAEDLLIFTKSTRLNLSVDLMIDIENMPASKKADELKYMANTIPSSWEFVDYVFLIEGVSRAYTHQQVRTRAGSYAQQTMRVTDQSDYDYIMPEAIQKDETASNLINSINCSIKLVYHSLLNMGHKAEDARGILPTNISTNIICKFNLRTLSELAKSRTGGRTQAEYREVINGVIDCVLEVHPWAEDFLFQHDRDYFTELEQFGKDKLESEERNIMLKIIDKMRKE